jgi:hypothetical protein
MPVEDAPKAGFGRSIVIGGETPDSNIAAGCADPTSTRSTTALQAAFRAAVVRIRPMITSLRRRALVALRGFEQ